MTLNELKIGAAAVITAVGGDGALRCRLLDMGIIPKTRVTLQKGRADGRSDRDPRARL